MDKTVAMPWFLRGHLWLAACFDYLSLIIVDSEFSLEVVYVACRYAVHRYVGCTIARSRCRTFTSFDRC